MKYRRAESPLELDGLDAARRFFASCFADTDPKRESLWVAHNHPVGDASPSESDRRATRRLSEAAQAIDLSVVDHVIFAGSEYRSFRRMGPL